MKHWMGRLLLIVLVMSMNSCYNTTLPKPDHLISKDKFVSMMVDIYLVQGLESSLPISKELKKVSQTDLYFSVLKKYSVPDTVFIRSLIYYSSFPKEYEKMHVQIMERLNASELQLKPEEKLDLKTK